MSAIRPPTPPPPPSVLQGEPQDITKGADPSILAAVQNRMEVEAAYRRARRMTKREWRTAIRDGAELEGG